MLVATKEVSANCIFFYLIVQVFRNVIDNLAHSRTFQAIACSQHFLQSLVVMKNKKSITKFKTFLKIDIEKIMNDQFNQIAD